MRRTPGRRTIGCALAALVAGLLVGSTTPSATAADPATCPWEDGVDGAVYTWVGGVNDNQWGGLASAANWTEPDGSWPAIPNDDQSPPMSPGHDSNEPGDPDDTFDTFVCVPAGKTVNIDADNTRFPFVQGIWVAAGSTVNIRAGAGLFVMSQDPDEESFFSAGSVLDVTAGTLGGRGSLRIQGSVQVKSPLTGGGASSLASKKVVGGDQVDSGVAGTLVIGPTGQMTLPDRGVQVVYGYRILVHGLVRLVGTGLLSANWGTRLELAGGTFDIAGDGGYYQGAKPSDVDQLSDFVNSGTLTKSAGSGVSIIDADYSGSGAVQVTSGQLALPDGDQRSAFVGGNSTLSTGQCEPGSGLEVCAPLLGGADPRSLAVTIPGVDGDGATVTIREDVPAPGLAFDGTTDIAGLDAQPLDPARIRLRMPSAPADQRPSLDNVRVGGDPGTGDFPTCLGSGTPPHGAIACVDRRGLPTSSRVEAGNLVMEVNYLANIRRSRWIVVREARDVAAPTLWEPTATKVKTKVLRTKPKVKPIPLPGLRCSEGCTVSGTGKLTVRLGGKKRTFRVKGTKAATAGETVTLRVKLAGKAQKKVARSSVKKGRVELLVTATDAAGNAVTLQATIKVKLKR